METLRKILKLLEPPLRWKRTVIVLLGIFCGILFLVVHISRAGSYLSDEPDACINCHVMYPHYASWTKSSHENYATCNDCHVPQDHFLRTYFFKASDGLRHATYFTMRWEPQVIDIKSAGVNVVQENCIRCHDDLVEMTRLVEMTGNMAMKDEAKLCWDCHRETPHGTVQSASAAPHALVKRLPSTLPSWMEGLLE